MENLKRNMGPRPGAYATGHWRQVMFRNIFIVAMSLPLISNPSELAADDLSVERAAAKLLKTTVTVRISAVDAIDFQSTSDDVLGAKANERKAVRAEARPGAAVPQDISEGVTVCSGALVGEGQILTFFRLPPQSPMLADLPVFRVTLPDGEQAVANPRVIDHYSGLVLLGMEKRDLAGLEIAPELPEIGGKVLTAAACGLETPLVSQGVLSGVDRVLPAAQLPPMILCDVSTTEASSGAAVIDQLGRMLGIIAATETPADRFGWSYAISLRQVRRVLAAANVGEIVVLNRERPTIGLTMHPGVRPGTVEVERVVPGGPADQVGIRPGDLVIGADGRKIRSAYQAVAMVLRHQPGDPVTFSIQRAGETKQVRLILARDAVRTSARRWHPQSNILVGPQVNVRLGRENQFEFRNSRRKVQPSSDTPNKYGTAQSKHETVLLKAQLQAYENVILSLQRDLELHRQREQQTARLIESLRQEVVEIKRRGSKP